MQIDLCRLQRSPTHHCQVRHAQLGVLDVHRITTIKHRLRNNYSRKAFDTLSETLVGIEIKKTGAALDCLSRDALTLHLKLAVTIRSDLWSVADARASLKASNQETKARNKQSMKLAKMKHIPIPQIVHLCKDLITVGTWGARASEELE